MNELNIMSITHVSLEEILNVKRQEKYCLYRAGRCSLQVCELKICTMLLEECLTK